MDDVDKYPLAINEEEDTTMWKLSTSDDKEDTDIVTSSYFVGHEPLVIFSDKTMSCKTKPVRIYTSKPANFFNLALLVTVCCNPPLGTGALVFSVLSNRDFANGDITSARRKGCISQWLSIVGIVMTFILAIFVLVYFILIMPNIIEPWDMPLGVQANQSHIYLP